MRKEPFKLYDLIQDILELINFKRNAQGRSVRISIMPNGNENIIVYADRQRIGQVLDNLISNAIYYGKNDGLVKILLQSQGLKLLVSVIDDGPGIAQEHLPKLFDRFYRVEKSRSRENGGTGLGLSIVKHILEAHDETITLESELGKGCNFTFSLTIHPDI